MAGFITTFERKEKKYVITAEQILRMKAGLAGKLMLDDYGATRIDSLYFDTPARDLISRSIEKPIYKEKLRVRAYGDAQPDSPVFIEIKKKFKGVVYKRRVSLSRAGAQAYFEGVPFEEAQRRFPIAGEARFDSRSVANLQIAREIDEFRSRYDQLGPSMLISCMREAWKPIDPNDPDTDLRITFDERISYVDVAQSGFDYDTAVAAEGHDFALDPSMAVMEIKCAGAYPLWLGQLLDECGIRPRSFSKYGSSYAIVSQKLREESLRRVSASVRARRATQARSNDHASSLTSALSTFFPKRFRQAAPTH